MNTLRLTLLILILGTATLVAQAPIAKPVADVPTWATALRQVEQLTRENDTLKATLRDRDTRINLATQEREFIIKGLTVDGTLAAGLKVRCDALEAFLRVIETPAKDHVFNCDTLTWGAQK